MSDVEPFLGKIKSLLDLLEESGVARYFPEPEAPNLGGRPDYDPCSMFAAVALAFSMKTSSLRDIESLCRFDVRFRAILGGQVPSHESFQRFINGVVSPSADGIFGCVARAIAARFSLPLADHFVDGTKIEANANKYKFVWRPAKAHLRLSDRARALLGGLSMAANVPEKGTVPSALLASKLTELGAMMAALGESPKAGGRGRRITPYQRAYNGLSAYLEKALDYEERERICGEGRNSYYKTDVGATAMCLKEDYYSGLGSEMHAGYNVQFDVSDGLICAFDVSQERNDMYAFVPVVSKISSMIGKKPENVCADAGYGSARNFAYLRERGIGNYVKSARWAGEMSGDSPALYSFGGGGLVCLAGRKGEEIDDPAVRRRKRGSKLFLVRGCSRCQFRAHCWQFLKKKTGNERVFEVSPGFEADLEESRRNLRSPKGIELRVNRSVQVEGSFGNVKQNMGYTRFRRRGLEAARAEVMMVCLGFNVRRFFRMAEKGVPRFWKAPDGLKAEEPKKPNPKTLCRRARNSREFSVNETSKKGYKRPKIKRK